MSKRKLSVLVLACLAAIAGLCLLLWGADRSSDRAHHQSWRFYGHLASGLDALEHLIGGDAAHTLGVQRLARSFEQKGNGEMEALIRSGYLVRVQFPVTNLASRCEQVVREWFSLPDHGVANEGIMGLDEASNIVTIICRPKYAPVFRTQFEWRSSDSALPQKAEAASRIVPRGTKQYEAERILGRPTRYLHFRAPVAAEPAYASLTNDLRLPVGTTEREAQNIWCDFYDFPDGGYVCFAFDAKASKWWADRPLVRVWFGQTNGARTITFPENER